MDLLIVRHGRSRRQEADDGDHADPELSDVGRRQAQRTADLLGNEGVDHVVSSTLRRALQTAEPLASRLGLEVEALEDLRESDHRSSVYVPVEEWDPSDPAIAPYLSGDLEGAVFPDGFSAFAERVGRAFDHVIATNRSRTVAVFCHGMVTATYLNVLLGLDDPFALYVDYCGITRVRASRDGLRTVRSVNETQHVRDLLGV